MADEIRPTDEEMQVIQGVLAPFYKQMQYWHHEIARDPKGPVQQKTPPDTNNDTTVKEPWEYPSIHASDHTAVYESKKRGPHPPHHPRREAVSYFHALEKAAEASNRQLKNKNVPYRFYIFEKAGEVYIDIVALDRENHATREIIRRVTHDDFIRLIDDVSNIEGLFIDTTR